MVRSGRRVEWRRHCQRDCEHTTIRTARSRGNHQGYVGQRGPRILAAHVELDLRIRPPQSYGPCNPHELIPPAVIGPLRLLKGCGLRLERIDGRAMKLAALDKDLREVVERTLWRIRDAIDPGNVWSVPASCQGAGLTSRLSTLRFGMESTIFLSRLRGTDASRTSNAPTWTRWVLLTTHPTERRKCLPTTSADRHEALDIEAPRNETKMEP